jgi:hypothetical protein
VAIDEQQTVAATPLQCEQVAQQNRAITAEHEWKLAAVDDVACGVGKSLRERRDAACVEGECRGVTTRIVRMVGHEPSGVPCLHPVDQASLKQRTWQRLDAGGAKTQNRWRFDHRHSRHLQLRVMPFSISWDVWSIVKAGDRRSSDGADHGSNR